MVGALRQSTTKDYVRTEGDFHKRYIVERTNEAEIRLEEQSEKTESRRRIFWMKHGWKGHKDRNRHKNKLERSEQARLVYVKNINRNIEGEPVGTTVSVNKQREQWQLLHSEGHRSFKG